MNLILRIPNMFFFFFIIIGFIVLAIVVAFMNSGDSNASQLSQTRANNARAVSNWKQNRADEFNNWITNMKNRYGEIETIIPIVTSDIHKTFLVFKERQEIYFSSSILKFKDILSCQLIDNPKVITGKVVAETKGDIWNEITRSSMQKSFGKTAGTWLAGPEKYTTEYKKTPDKVYHNYSILINTTNIATPIFEIKVGNEAQIAYRINAIIDAIIANNNS